MSFHQFSTEENDSYGSFEVFSSEDGFYWQPCFPGCIPDGDAIGPFMTEEEALEDAQS